MEAVFLKILHMSLSASAVIAVVLLIRLCLRRAPKKWSYLLWSAAGFRLAVPVSLKSVFSIFRLAELRPGPGETAVTAVGPALSAPAVLPRIAAVLPRTQGAVGAALPPSAPEIVADPLQAWLTAGTVLWCAGAALMVLWGIVSYLLLRRQLVGAVRVAEDVYETDRIRVPFLLGLVRPRIYVPLHLEAGTLGLVTAHERTHIRRCDHWVKCLAFLLLTIHWFNPLVWLAFCLMSRDMEMSCDEKVLSAFGTAKTYSLSLLSFAAVRRFPSPAPLAFGETGVRQRIRNALRWKKPRLWVTTAAAVLCLAVLAACATDPAEKQEASIAAVSAAEAPEGEPAAPPTQLTEAVEEAVSFTAELDGDGTDERILLYEKADGGCILQVRSGADGSLLLQDELFTAHAGWRSWYLCDSPDRKELLCYSPAFGTGVGEYSFSLYRFAAAAPGDPSVQTSSVEFSLTPMRVELPAEEMAEFAGKLNELLEGGTLLVSTVNGEVRFGPAVAEPETFALLDEYEELIPGGLPETASLEDRIRTLEAALRVYWADAAETAGVSAFPELDPDSLEMYLTEIGLTLADAENGILIDEAGPEQSGTSIQTVYGDTVLALDTARGITLVRIDDRLGQYYRGILAIVQDPSAVSLAMASGDGMTGQKLSEIAEDRNAMLAIGASSYVSSDGSGLHSEIPFGLAVSRGERVGEPVYNSNFSAVWLDYEDILHVEDWKETEDIRDGVQFQPALVVDGKATVASQYAGWGKRRRTAIAQRWDGAILMAVMDYNGVEMDDLTELLLRYGAVQACNLDGGSAALMYYNGRIVTRRSMEDWPIPKIPNAFVVRFEE